MTPIVQLYWIRTALGIVAGALSAALALFMNATDLTTFVNCFTIALIVYLASYYPLKAIFQNKVEKQSKILSTGIAMFFFAWLPFFVLFFTVMKIYT